LRDPAELERIVRACVEVVGDMPLTGKIRAGYDDDRLLEDLAAAVEAGGASMLTVHCRTRAEAYCDEVDWTRIARAVKSVSIPVCGNGGVGSHADLERMRRETGCALVMVGRAALGDPWIFSGRRVDRAEAASFLVEYAERLLASGDAGVRGAAARVKQLLNHWTAGDLVLDRSSWLRETDPSALLDRLRFESGRLPLESGQLGCESGRLLSEVEAQASA
jgi:tRNA-dihydrouridine synthase